MKCVELRERPRLVRVEEEGRCVMCSHTHAADAQEGRSRLLQPCSHRGIFHREAGQHSTRWPSKQERVVGCWYRKNSGSTNRSIAVDLVSDAEML